MFADTKRVPRSHMSKKYRLHICQQTRKRQTMIHKTPHRKPKIEPRSTYEAYLAVSLLYTHNDVTNINQRLSLGQRMKHA